MISDRSYIYFQKAALPNLCFAEQEVKESVDIFSGLVLSENYCLTSAMQFKASSNLFHAVDI